MSDTEIKQPITDPWAFSAKHPERPCPEFDINQYNKEKREKPQMEYWAGLNKSQDEVNCLFDFYSPPKEPSVLGLVCNCPKCRIT